MKRKLKVLFITESFPPYANGGAGISTSLIVKAISKGCDCRIITQKFNDEKSWKFEGFDVLPVLDNYSPNFNSSWKLICSLSRNIFYSKIYKEIKNQIKQFKPDILHIQLNHYDLISRIISLEIPSIVDFRDSMLSCPIMLRMQPCDKKCFYCLNKYFSIKYEDKKVIKNILRLSVPIILYTHKSKKKRFVKAINNSENVIICALSNYIKNTLIDEKIKDSKIKVIYNLINVSSQKRESKKENRIVFAGSVDFSKGIFTILNAINIINDKNLEMIILGEGSELDKAKRLSKKNNLNVSFLGKVSQKEVLDFYNNSKIILGPSILPEPFGRFIQEGISTRTPVIATRVGGIPEGIKDHETGLLVEPNNPKQLAKAIKELLTDKKLYNKIVKNLEGEAQKYSPEVIGKQRLELYNEFIKNHNKHAPKQK
jgi:glycosyltransferase involved in cell wall biosynthesis